MQTEIELSKIKMPDYCKVCNDTGELHPKVGEVVEICIKCGLPRHTPNNLCLSKEDVDWIKLKYLKVNQKEETIIVGVQNE